MDKLELFEAFEKVTEKIIYLDVTSDDVINKVESYIEERQKLISEIDAVDGSISEEVLNRILQKNVQAETKLEEIMLNIKGHIQSIVKEKSLSSTKKRANRGYMNLGHQTDGYFIDKKK